MSEGREGALKAMEALDRLIERTPLCAPQSAISFAVEQLRAQAVKHIQTLYPNPPNQTFLDRMASAIRTLQALHDVVPAVDAR